MLRIFRKYNKIILAIFGTLLLIVFLIPQAITALAKQSAAGGGTWAEITLADGSVEALTTEDLSAAQNALRILERGFGSPLQRLNVERPEHFYLLMREAADAGLIASLGDAQRSFLRRTDLGDDPMAALISRAGFLGVSRSQLLSVYAQLLGVGRLLSQYEGAVKTSDARLRRFADEIRLSVTADLMVLLADDSEDGLAEPAEDALLSQFEEYKAVDANDVDAEFGYLLPDRARVEWIGVTAESVRTALDEAGRPTSLEVRKHWLQNRVDFIPFGGETEDEAILAAVYERVRVDLLNELTDTELDVIARFAEAELNKRIRMLTQGDVYRKVTDNWRENQQLSLPQLAEDIQREMTDKYRLRLPEYQNAAGKWLSAADLGTLGAVSIATTSKFGGTKFRLSQLVAGAKELGGSNDFVIQQNVAGPVLRTGFDGDGDVYVFRITATDPSRTPRNIEEVRDDVVRDLKIIAHHGQLAAALDDLRDEAIREGFEEFAKAHGTFPLRNLSIALAEEQLFRFGFLQPGRIRGLGEDEGSVREVLRNGRELLERSMREQRPVPDLPLNDRIFAMDVPEEQAVVVYRIIDVVPFLEEEYTDLAGTVMRLMQQDEFGDTVLDAFSEDALVKRHNFTLSRPRQSEEDEEDAAPEDTAGTNAG